VASEHAGIEVTLPELQRRCVLLVARDIASHSDFPLQQSGQLQHSWRKLIQGIMHRIWAPAVRMVCGDYMDCEALGVDFRGKQLLDVCLVVLGGTVSVVDSMPQGQTCVDIQQLRHELELLVRLSHQRADFDCVI
jgi:hypothetical protein